MALMVVAVIAASAKKKPPSEGIMPFGGGYLGAHIILRYYRAIFILQRYYLLRDTL